MIALTKENQDRMAEESRIQSSLTEDDMKQYLEQVIREVKMHKNTNNDAWEWYVKYVRKSSKEIRTIEHFSTIHKIVTVIQYTLIAVEVQPEPRVETNDRRKRCVHCSNLATNYVLFKQEGATIIDDIVILV